MLRLFVLDKVFGYRIFSDTSVSNHNTPSHGSKRKVKMDGSRCQWHTLKSNKEGSITGSLSSRASHGVDERSSALWPVKFGQQSCAACEEDVWQLSEGSEHNVMIKGDLASAFFCLAVSICVLCVCWCECFCSVLCLRHVYKNVRSKRSEICWKENPAMMTFGILWCQHESRKQCARVFVCSYQSRTGICMMWLCVTSRMQCVETFLLVRLWLNNTTPKHLHCSLVSVANLGHSRSRAVSNHHTELLPKCQRSHSRVWRHERGDVSQYVSMAGGREAIRWTKHCAASCG